MYDDGEREWRDDGCSQVGNPACGNRNRRGRGFKGALMGTGHPQLTLEFRAGDAGDAGDDSDGVVVATFTHRFDRFVRAVEGAGMAAVGGGRGGDVFRYEVAGLVHEVEASLMRGHDIPRHILSISDEARARSNVVFQARKAEEAALCEAADLAERMANGGDHERRTLTSHQLLEALKLVAERATMVTLFCMLRASKFLRKAAQHAASHRITRARLRLLPATNGVTIAGPNAFDYELTSDVDEYEGDADSPAVVIFTKLKPIKLDFEVRDPDNAVSATFRPPRAAARFSWSWCVHDHPNYDWGHQEDNIVDESDCIHSGHKVLVQWTPRVEDGMPDLVSRRELAEEMLNPHAVHRILATSRPPAAVTLRTLQPLQASGGEHRLGGYGLVVKHRVTDRSCRDEDGVEREDGDCEVLSVHLTFGWLMRLAAAKVVGSYRASVPPTLADQAYKQEVIEPLRQYVQRHDRKAREEALRARTATAGLKKRRKTSQPLGAPDGGSKASSA